MSENPIINSHPDSENNIERNFDALNQSSDFQQMEQSKLSLLKPNFKRAKVAQLFVWAVMAIEILSVISSYLQFRLLKDFENGEEVTELMIASNDTREQWMGISYTVLFIISGFTFIMWFRRAYYNLSIRTTAVHDHSWAAGSWFVPFLNLIRPYRIMMELSSKTSQLINLRTTQFTHSNSTLIGMWWTLWILGNFGGNLLMRETLSAETVEELLQSTSVAIGVSAFMIPVSIVTVLMIQSYAQKEELLTKLESTSNPI